MRLDDSEQLLCCKSSWKTSSCVHVLIFFGACFIRGVFAAQNIIYTCSISFFYPRNLEHCETCLACVETVSKTVSSFGIANKHWSRGKKTNSDCSLRDEMSFCPVAESFFEPAISHKKSLQINHTKYVDGMTSSLVGCRHEKTMRVTITTKTRQRHTLLHYLFSRIVNFSWWHL